MKTTKLKMLDLVVSQLDDGEILLEQMDCAGERSAVCLYPIQLRQVAEAVGLASPSVPAGWANQVDVGPDWMDNLDVTRDDDDGTVTISQTQISGMGGSDNRLTLHPIQAAWLGARLLAMPNDADDNGGRQDQDGEEVTV
jgi:hypothetical protein